MIDAFWLQVGLSFIVAGVYIAGTIWLAEKFGSRLGGLLVGLPSTALVSLFFIGWNQGTAAMIQATSVMPLSIIAVTGFMIAFHRLNRFGLLKAYTLAIGIWLGLSIPLVVLSTPSMLDSMGLAALALAAGWAYFQGVPDQTTKDNRFNKNEFLFRAAFSGLVVATAIALAKTQGPLWGGALAMFPAAFSSTILLLWHKQGAAFTDSVMKTMQRALACIGAFVVAAHYAVGPFGLLGGLALAYVVSVLTAVAIQLATSHQFQGKNKTKRK